MRLKALIMSILGLTIAIQATAQTKPATDTPALPFNRIVAFGDSLSDNGNINKALLLAHQFNSNIPILPTPGTGYFEGRFSNGPTWIEDVATDLHLTGNKPLQDNAYGGARINYNDLQGNPTFFPPNLLVQLAIDHPFEKYLHANDQTLYVFWIGGNDYIHGIPQDPTSYVQQTLATYKSNLDDAIADDQIKYLMIVNMPDIANTPYVRSLPADQQQTVANMIDLHNTGLYQVYQQEKAAHPDIKIAYYDVFSYMKNEEANPAQSGLTNVTDACLQGTNAKAALKLSNQNQNEMKAFANLHWWNPSTNKFQQGGSLASNPSLMAAYKVGVLKQQNALNICSNPDTYMFWDDVHPTAHEHQDLAQTAESLIYSTFGETSE